MKINTKNILILFVVSMISFSCEKDLDINTNPNLPSTVDKGFVLTAAQSSLATVLGGSLTNYGGFMVQYHTQSPGASQYINIDSYSLSSDFTNILWTEVFAGGINDLDFVIEQSIEEKDNAAYLISKILRAYIFQVMTDLFGDIPYADKLQGVSNLSPDIVAQQDIYEALISSIDEALLRYKNNSNKLVAFRQDILLRGDMTQWMKFANTLKLKMLLRLSYTSNAKPTKVLSLLAEDNFISKDISFGLYEDITNKRNPFSDVQLNLLNGKNNSASNSLLKFLSNNSDPRLSKIYNATREGVFTGLDQGNRNQFLNKSSSDFATPNVSPTKPVYFMTVAESNFLQAEALIRYKSGMGAQSKYEAGIKASFQNYGLSAADADDLISGVYAYTPNSDIEISLRQVIIQKWASMAYVNNIEAYFEQIRTGFPEFVASEAVADYTKGNLIISKLSRTSNKNSTPKSMLYPDVEVTRNKNMNQKSSTNLKVWWDKK